MSADTVDEEVRLDTPEAFFQALRSPDLRLRMATLGAVYREPQAALAFGTVAGEDVVALLATDLKGTGSSVLHAALAQTLFVFDDPGSLEAAQWEFAHATELDDLLPTVRRIFRAPHPSQVPFFLPFCGRGRTSFGSDSQPGPWWGNPPWSPENAFGLPCLQEMWGGNLRL